MTSWRDEAVDQLGFWWEAMFWPRVQGLTDEEYFWEPAANSWNVRPDPGGGFTLDWSWPAPEPAPVTTIAWRLAHIGSGVFAVRNASHFGGPPWDMGGREWPGTATAALDWVAGGYERWKAGVSALSDDELARAVGPAEGPFADAPMLALVMHINREVIHHGAEVCLLRDLYRAWVRTSA